VYFRTGLKGRRSGGRRFGSLTTRLNVPVVRGRLGFESERSHKIGHYVPSSAMVAVCQLPVGRQQVSNESLILAQNQRWRRA
jgi:hypothetical protein